MTETSLSTTEQCSQLPIGRSHNEIVAELVASGLNQHQLTLLLELVSISADKQPIVVRDSVAERRRAYDRTRKAEQRRATPECPVESPVDIRVDTTPSPPSSPPSMVSPITPSLTTPSPTPSTLSVLRTDDPRTQLFNRGLASLAQMTGKTPSSCRSLMGRWLKGVDDEAYRVLGAIDDAAQNRVADPVAWITRSLKPHQRGSNGSRNGVMAAFDDLLARAASREVGGGIEIPDDRDEGY